VRTDALGKNVPPLSLSLSLSLFLSLFLVDRSLGKRLA
jgi:hypothetical protein